MARKWLPDNVTPYKDRHGKTRYRFRKKGLPAYHFRNPPGTEEFREEYARALSAEKVTESRFAPFTYDALIESFYQSPRWVGMRASSQNTYRGIIERFRAKNGNKDVRGVTAGAIEAKLVKLGETPSAANNLRKALARLHRHAIKLDWRKDNPVDATDGFKIENDGFHTWTEAEIAAYEAKWPLGTRERLAMALLLYTALRKSDMVLVGPQHRKGDKFVLHHGKNNSETIIPILSPLSEALDAFPGEHLAYLVTQFGKPFTPAGFGNWFRDRCDLAGLAHCSAHGLRKAMSRRLAESGATNQQGRAITGHKTDREFNRYAEKANRTTMAEGAMDKLVANHAWRTGEQEKTNG